MADSICAPVFCKWVYVCFAVQRERSRSPLNLVVSPASRRSTDSTEPGTPASDHAPSSAGVSATSGVTPGQSGAAFTKARLHDFFSVTDTSAGALEVCLHHHSPPLDISSGTHPPPDSSPPGQFLSPLVPLKRAGFYRAMLCVTRTMLSQDVRLSACLSHAGIVSKRLDISSNFFHQRVATSF